MKIETGITLTVYADHDYHFDVSVLSDEMSVTYVEAEFDTHGQRLSFGSIEEMQAVAHAMLKAIELRKAM